MTLQDITFTQSRWSLADLFPSHDSSEMKAAFTNLESSVADFESRRPELVDEIDQKIFMDLIRELEGIYRLAYRMEAYASLWFSEDTQNPDAPNFLAQVDQFMAGMQNRVLFFNLWWKALDESVAQRLMAEAGDFRYWLEEMRHFKPHTLSEPEEKVINIKNVTGVNALTTLYETITNRYTFKLEVDGKTKELTRGELMVYVRDNDPDLRAAAYQELYRVYGDDGSILGQMYQTLVRDWRNEHVDLRHYSNPIATRNLMNDIPDEVVDTLLEVSQRNADIFQRYFQLKARWLGIERLRRYDLYAPVAKSEKTYDYADAAQMVLDSFEGFEPKISVLAQRVFAEGHLDSEVRKGKMGGAFCMSVYPGLTPWVLLNYQNKPDEIGRAHV